MTEAPEPAATALADATEPEVTNTTDVVPLAREVAQYDPDTRHILLPTPIAGLQLEFLPDQRNLTGDQMRLLSPLGIEASWDPNEVLVFLLDAMRRGFDPWANEAYLMRYPGRKYIKHIGIAGFRRKGEESGQYAGRTPQQWCGPDGHWLDVWLNGDTVPAGARVGILRKGFDAPVWGIATYDEFAPMMDEKVRVEDPRNQGEFILRPTGNQVPTPMWRPGRQGGKPSVMLAKCAEAQGWRAAFPHRFNGWYAPEELQKLRLGPEVDDATSAARRRAAFEQAQAGEGEAQSYEPERERVVVIQGTAVETPQSSPAADDAATQLPENARELLLAELEEQAAILGKDVAWMTKRWSEARGGRSFDTATLSEVLGHVTRYRPYVVAALRAAEKHQKASTYEAWGKVMPGTLAQLFGQESTQDEPERVGEPV